MKYEQLAFFDECPCGGYCTAENCKDCTCSINDAPNSEDPSEAKFEAPTEVTR